MMKLCVKSCPHCQSEDFKVLLSYQTKCDGKRNILECKKCSKTISETYNTFLFNIKTPIERIATILLARLEGMAFNAACRTFNVGTHTLQNWEKRLGAIKEVLVIYSLSHQFLEQIIEGDELYTKIGKNTDPMESQGWTIVLMERASRFIWELSCNEKNKMLFMQAIETLSDIIKQTEQVALFTDGERRYSSLLFDICSDLLHTGKPGRPRKVLRKGVVVRVKNKGDQSHKKGPKKEKYQTPKPEHPETHMTIHNSDIHANHLEGQNAAMRRRNSAYRRKTNTYSKCKEGLQRTLDCYWVFHNFIKKHYTTKAVPAVKLGIMDIPLTWRNVFCIQLAF